MKATGRRPVVAEPVTEFDGYDNRRQSNGSPSRMISGGAARFCVKIDQDQFRLGLMPLLDSVNVDSENV
jgi:hypothetical protein